MIPSILRKRVKNFIQKRHIQTHHRRFFKKEENAGEMDWDVQV